MTFQFIDDLDRIREAHARDERFIVVFLVEDANKIQRLGEFVDKLDLFAPLAGRSCFLKPNMVSSEHYPTTTDAEVLRFVLERLKGTCSKVAVGDSPAQGKMDMYEHPVAKMCEELVRNTLHSKGKVRLKNTPDFFSVWTLPSSRRNTRLQRLK
ncbi:MAG: DUF362 domain-containing protein, partial [Candidatus Thermoplasmatota archaeon]|nr:DUF362 domain-containing protein [Candidatus Thermoplasmatota archaeon]